MAKKRYYQGKKDKMDESKGMKMYEDKKMYKKDMKMDKKEMKYLSYDESLFGFPYESKVVDYPKNYYFNQASGAYKDDISGTDYEIDKAVEGLNRNKSNYRF